jgi:AcrR family transcriptional regulator
MDMYLQAEPIRPDQSHRLGYIHFPTALDWLRTEDVIRLVPSWAGEAANQRAFFRRWPTRADFLSDAVVYALLRENDPPPHPLNPAASVSQLVIEVADELLTSLVRHPRSYLVLHLGPLLPRHPQLADALLPSSRATTRVWLELYRRLADGLDLVMRPEWTFKRLSSVLQAMLDGFVLRDRLQAKGNTLHGWQGANILADAIIALLLGAVDWDLTGQSGRAALDSLTKS